MPCLPAIDSGFGFLDLLHVVCVCVCVCGLHVARVLLVFSKAATAAVAALLLLRLSCCPAVAAALLVLWLVLPLPCCGGVLLRPLLLQRFLPDVACHLSSFGVVPFRQEAISIPHGQQRDGHTSILLWFACGLRIV